MTLTRDDSQRLVFWRRMWFSAALFNFVIGVPIIVAAGWTYALAFGTQPPAIDDMALRLWRDFGIFVVIIGAGYYLISRNMTANGGLVLTGIAAKLFDVISLSYRYLAEIAEPLVLVPATIDAIYAALFIAFYIKWKRGEI